MMASENIAYNLSSTADLVTVRQNQPYHHQLPPYGNQGSPFVIAKHKLIYSERPFKLKWSMFERKRLQEQLDKCFPPIYVLAHGICIVLHSLIMIGLQIAMMVSNGALWYVASGIWGGVVFLIVGIITIALVMKRTYGLLIASYLLHILGLLIAIGAYLVVNVIGIALYTDNCAIEPQLTCYNLDVKPISYIMFWLGVIIIIMVLVYLFLMPLYIMDCCFQASRFKDQKEKNEKLDDDFLQHSSLYAQNNLNPDGTVKVENILSVKTTRYDYSVEPLKRY